MPCPLAIGYPQWFALGILDSDETRAAVAHIASGCPECVEAFQAARRVIYALAQAITEGRAPPREALLARIGGLRRSG